MGFKSLQGLPRVDVIRDIDAYARTEPVLAEDLIREACALNEEAFPGHTMHSWASEQGKRLAVLIDALHKTALGFCRYGRADPACLFIEEVVIAKAHRCRGLGKV